MDDPYVHLREEIAALHELTARYARQVGDEGLARWAEVRAARARAEARRWQHHRDSQGKRLRALW